jgi:hypothetical protein
MSSRGDPALGGDITHIAAHKDKRSLSPFCQTIPLAADLLDNNLGWLSVHPCAGVT